MWQTFPPDAEIQQWLGELPSDEELDGALKAMKIGKAPRVDAIMVEYLRHGRPELRKEVYAAVRAAWEAATHAEDGHEATDWDAAWRLGLMCPL